MVFPRDNTMVTIGSSGVIQVVDYDFAQDAPHKGGQALEFHQEEAYGLCHFGEHILYSGDSADDGCLARWNLSIDF